MYRLKLVLSITFIVALVLLMVIPIGSGAINNIYIIGFRLDYVIHCLIYLPWMFVGKAIFQTRYRSLQWLIIGLITSLLLECIQYILPYRSFNINDLIAGTVGVMLSYFMLKLTQRLKCCNTEK